jgi:hypothetical protein
MMVVYYYNCANCGHCPFKPQDRMMDVVQNCNSYISLLKKIISYHDPHPNDIMNTNYSTNQNKIDFKLFSKACRHKQEFLIMNTLTTVGDPPR